MPKTAIDYSKTIIYKIVCNDLAITDLYVGSTTDFTRRKSEHRRACNNIGNKGYNLKIYKTIRDNGYWENWSIFQIEEYNCANGKEAKARERHWFEQLNANLNIRYPARSQREYDFMHKDKKTAYIRENKDKIKERDSQPYTCECGSVVRIAEKARHFKSKKHQEFIAQKDNTEIKI